ncbi:MAG: bacillithiol transferase BstA [Bacteroidetes bacterium]|nr:bacillithiol transferase BstA [Bacteroidota bacterium]
MDVQDPRYPIGKYLPQADFTKEVMENWLAIIAALPTQLDLAIKNLNDDQLDTPYRDGGWTVRQVVHHVADSHMNAYIRFKLALTEENPTIKPYQEERWAELADSKYGTLEDSLMLLKVLHSKWSHVMQNMSDEEWDRTFTHPQYNRVSTLKFNLGLYAWHSQHHTAHITHLRSRKGWI